MGRKYSLMRNEPVFAKGSITRPPVHKIPIIQVLVLALAACIAYLFDGRTSLSWVIGGLVCIIPNVYFSYYAFRYSGARVTNQLLQSMYRGAVGKFVLTMLGFAMVFAGGFEVEPLMVFLGYGLMLLIHYCVSSSIFR